MRSRAVPPAPRPAPRRGLFITFEGPEGSGKSSQSRLLARRLRRSGRLVVRLRDPGSTTLGRALRRLLLHSREPLSPMAEALLFIGGRVRLVRERIRPALAAGRIVVCDRYHDATVAYQGWGGGVDAAWLDAHGRRAVGGLMPDLTLLLDLAPERGFARLGRSRDRIERNTAAFHRRVRRGYLRIAAREPRRVVTVDATRPRADVAAAIADAVAERMPARRGSPAGRRRGRPQRRGVRNRLG
ncbi:MAG TPA: dTMP kinase [bacterium]